MVTYFQTQSTVVSLRTYQILAWLHISSHFKAWHSAHIPRKCE